MKTKFTKKEAKRLNELRQKYQDLDDEITGYRKSIREAEKERDKCFAEFWSITHPEQTSTIDRNLLPYGWN